MAPNQENCILEFKEEIKLVESQSFLGVTETYIDLKEFDVSIYPTIKKVINEGVDASKNYGFYSSHAKIVEKIGGKIYEKYNEKFPLFNCPLFGKYQHSPHISYEGRKPSYLDTVSHEPSIYIYRNGAIVVSLPNKKIEFKYSDLLVTKKNKEEKWKHPNLNVKFYIKKFKNNEVTFTLRVDGFSGSWYAH